MSVSAIRVAVDGRSLVSDAMFNRLTTRIAADHPELAPDMPARIVDQALAFLGACAVSTEPIGPSDIVDIGWHTFILYTRDYAAFCDRVAGRFIHHEPDDASGDEWPTVPGSVSFPISKTVEAVRVAGYRVDGPLWQAGAAKCGSNCHQCHAGCHNSPTR